MPLDPQSLPPSLSTFQYLTLCPRKARMDNLEENKNGLRNFSLTFLSNQFIFFVCNVRYNARKARTAIAPIWAHTLVRTTEIWQNICKHKKQHLYSFNRDGCLIFPLYWCLCVRISYILLLFHIKSWRGVDIHLRAAFSLHLFTENVLWKRQQLAFPRS